jgi:serine/threonine protein phosphatase 1
MARGKLIVWPGRRSGVYPAAPEGRAIYVVGDIHGRLDLLKGVHDDIDADKRKGHAQTVEIYLGDYIDRGPQSAEVISTLIARANGTYAVFLRGNHEQLLLDFLAGEQSLLQWKGIGVVPTLLSYGVPASLLSGDVPEDRIRDALAERIPKEHFDFLVDTGSYCAVDSYLMVHAGIRPGVKLENQSADDLFQIREEFLEYEGDFGFIVVHGHTPVMEPEFRPNRINIDTGAFATSRLTCLKIGADGPSVLAREGAKVGG